MPGYLKGAFLFDFLFFCNPIFPSTAISGIKGYSINQKRLQEQNARLAELQDTVNLMGRVIQGRELDKAESAGLLNVITEYSYALSLLDQYDHQELKIHKTTRKKQFIITYELARKAIDTLGEQSRKKGQPTGLFGKEKDKSFKGSLGAIYQTFGRKEVYPSIEEKAAHLLYFVSKPRICSSHLLRLVNPCCNACFTIFFLTISIDMPSSKNRSNYAFRCGSRHLATTPTAKSGLKPLLCRWQQTDWGLYVCLVSR